jgi:hypothetical protein
MISAGLEIAGRQPRLAKAARRASADEPSRPTMQVRTSIAFLQSEFRLLFENGLAQRFARKTPGASVQE